MKKILLILIFASFFLSSCTEIQKPISEIAKNVEKTVSQTIGDIRDTGGNTNTRGGLKGSDINPSAAIKYANDPSPFSGRKSNASDDRIGAAISCDFISSQFLTYPDHSLSNGIINAGINAGIIHVSSISNTPAFTDLVKTEDLSGTKFLPLGCWMIDSFTSEQLGGETIDYAVSTYQINPLIKSSELENYAICAKVWPLENIVHKHSYSRVGRGMFLSEIINNKKKRKHCQKKTLKTIKELEGLNRYFKFKRNNNKLFASTETIEKTEFVSKRY